MTKFLLDSGDPQEYKEISALLKQKGDQLWGSTTNPSLIAKKIASEGKKLTTQEAFALQKQIVLEIIDIVPGAVSGEVYADDKTTSQEMVEQGREIASWHPRVVVKLPTTKEGFLARTELRKEGVGINNTLVFSQQQVFAICLHEKLMLQQYGPAKTGFPAFISPFVGRLDDKNENGLEFVSESIQILRKYFTKDIAWMLEASVRNVYHMKAAIENNVELITVPASIYEEWFGLTPQEQDEINVNDHLAALKNIPIWQPSENILGISNINQLMQAIESGKLNITHPLTIAGIDKFVKDWKAILA